MTKIVNDRSIAFRTPLAIPVKSVGDSIPYNTLEIKVAFRKKDYSRPNRFVVIVKPVRVSNGIVSCSYGPDLLTNGFTVEISTPARFSAKVMNELASKIEPAVEEVAKRYSNRDLAGADDALSKALGIPLWSERKKVG